MNEMLEIGKLYCKFERYQKRKYETLEKIKEMLRICPDAYISCSFGKDSSALLHLVMSVKKDVEARFLKWDESDLLHDYPTIMNKFQKMGANVKILHLSRSSLDEKVADRWQLLADLSKTGGNFVGMRASESRGRRLTLRKDGEIFLRKNGTYRLCPLANWTDNDIAAYHYENNLPMLDEYVKNGVQARTTARIPRNDWFIRQEMLCKLKSSNPANFEKLAQIYEEVREYA